MRTALHINLSKRRALVAQRYLSALSARRRWDDPALAAGKHTTVDLIRPIEELNY
jgi:hypothetical protein